jgi:hypothetical protein
LHERRATHIFRLSWSSTPLLLKASFDIARLQNATPLSLKAFFVIARLQSARNFTVVHSKTRQHTQRLQTAVAFVIFNRARNQSRMGRHW